MEPVDVLREQAAILRAVANSFDDQSMREQLLDLAARCDALAESMEKNRLNAPDFPPDLH